VKHPFAQLVVGLVFALVAFAARLALDLVAPGVIPFATFYPAVLLATLVGGWLAGVVTLASGLLLVWYLVMPPRFSFAVESSGQALSLALFAVTAGLLVVVAERLWRQAERLRAEAATRSEAERRLGQTATELESVLATVPAAVWFTYGDRVEQVRRNAYAAALMRLPADVVGALGSSGDDRISGRWIERDGTRLAPDELPLQRALKGQSSADEELDLVFEDGTRRTLLSNAKPLSGPGGSIVGAVSVSLDISDRKQIAQALASSEARLARILETSPVAILETDRLGRITFANPAAARILKLAPSDITGRAYDAPAWGITLPDGNPLSSDLLPAARALRGEAVHGFEHAVVDPSGNDRVILSVDAVPILDDTGAVAGVLTAFTDISARYAAEQALRLKEASYRADLEAEVAARTADLELANAQLRDEIVSRQAAEARARQAQKMEAVGQLTGGVAHDFNNILAIVIGSLDVAGRRLARGDGDVTRFIDTAMEGARRGATLTQRLLAFSRQSPLSPVVIDVNGIVRGMEDLLRRTIGEQISLEFVLAGGLWLTRIDAGQLEQAILNLVVNARDAMPEGGKLTLETMNAFLDDDYAAAHTDVVAGQYVEIAVSDTGSGMPADVIARAFDPFFTTKPSGKGTGLGLSQVYGFMKQSGGHVKIYSEAGQGTTVKIYLRRELAGAVVTNPSPQATTPRLPLGSQNEIILVVEDDIQVRQATVRSLRELGYTVRHASSGAEALELLSEQPMISVLFTDVVMPGMSGRALAEAARAKYPDLKVLFTTGYTPNAIVHNGTVDAGVELLTKPFTIDQLARKLRNMLDR
jgi:PAS domain S-box-containing protein